MSQNQLQLIADYQGVRSTSQEITHPTHVSNIWFDVYMSYSIINFSHNNEGPYLIDVSYTPSVNTSTGEIAPERIRTNFKKILHRLQMIYYLLQLLNSIMILTEMNNTIYVHLYSIWNYCHSIKLSLVDSAIFCPWPASESWVQNQVYGPTEVSLLVVAYYRLEWTTPSLYDSPISLPTFKKKLKTHLIQC